MRAAWVESITPASEHILTGDLLHHLVKVVRLEAGEELLLLDGHGLKVKTKVSAVTKREMRLEQLEILQEARRYEFDLALGIPKREALELSLKEATELGFRRIYLIRAEYSQMKLPELERLQRLLISALEQSNSAFLPELIETDWEDLPWQEYGLNLMMDSQSLPGIQRQTTTEGPRLLVVGPEGGFSPTELQFLHSRPKLEVLTLPTPILRTPTAVATGAGVLLQRLMD